MDERLSQILHAFRLDSAPIRCQNHGSGHINRSYLVVTESGRRYLLQKMNNRAFSDIAALQENIVAVTTHLRRKTSDPNAVLTPVFTESGQSWLHFAPESDWRVFHFIENAVCLERAESLDDFYQSAIAFGRFQQQLADFPAASLHETIPRFHDTPHRFTQLKEAIARDRVGRADGVQREIDWALSYEADADRLLAQLRAGTLPLRVTHNDTKLNNVMLRADTHTPLCVVDLDTTMPGLSAYDFGDSIRFGAATAAEDERDLEKMRLDLEKFRVFSRGFLCACPDLTAAERDALPLGALLMTLECGTRFLADYLDGDRYYSVAYPTHNLDRCRTQLRLAADLQKQWDAMARIVREEA